MSTRNTITGIPYWRLSGFYFLFFVTVGIFLPYWSLYLKSIGMSGSEIGILSSILVLSKIFISYFWGWVVDNTGKRMRVIRIASLFSVITFSAALLVQDFWGLALVLFIFSLFWSASLPQIEAVTLTHLGDSTHAYTNIRVWGSVGFIVAVWILGIAFDTMDISFVPAIILVSMILVWLQSLTVPEQAVVYPEKDGAAIKSVLLKPEVMALLLTCFLMLFSHGPYYTFYSIYLEENGYSRTFIGEMWALGVLAEVVLFIFMQKLFRVFSLRTVLICSLVMAVFRWLLVGYYVDNIYVLVVAQLLHAATFGSFHAAAIQYIHRYFSGRLQGRGQALYSSISFGAGMALGSLASGYMWDQAGALISFTGAALAALLALVIAWFWIRE